jgi:hypothetical protein
MTSRFRVRRRLAAIALFLAAGVAFAGIGLAVNAWLTPVRKPSAFPPAAYPVPARGAPTAPSPSLSPRLSASARPALASPVRVVPGAHDVVGLFLGYPHTLVGAVSAAAAYTPAIIGTLDPDRATHIMRMVADPSFSQGTAQAAEGIASIRESLGLAAGGPVPQGYAWAVRPLECQVRGIGRDRVTVLLLLDLISVVPGAGTITRASVFPVAVHWAAGDWRILPTPATSYARLTAAPGSQQAASLGWLQLTGEQS